MKIHLTRIKPKNQSKLEPLSLSYLKTVLIQKGFKHIDISLLNIKKFYNPLFINKFIKYDVIGFNVDISNFLITLKAIKQIKKKNKKVKIILGGHYPSLLAKNILNKYNCINIIINGEGELSFYELIKNFEKKKPIDKIKGITFRKNGLVKINPPRGLIKDLNNLPIPIRSKNIYKNKKTKLITEQIQSSRGCPYICNFCSIKSFYRLNSRESWRSRNPESVINEINYLYKTKKVNIINFIDDNFLVDYKRARSILNKVKNLKKEIKITFMTRPDQILNFKKELIKFHKSIHCVDLGIESGSKTQIKRFNKNLDLNKSIEAIKFFKNNSINCEISNIFWDPEISLKEIKENINFLKKINKFNINYIFRPLDIYPGTNYFNKLNENNLLLGDIFFPKYKFKYEESEKIFSWVHSLNKKIKNSKLKNQIFKKKIEKLISNTKKIKITEKYIKYNSVLFRKVLN